MRLLPGTGSTKPPGNRGWRTIRLSDSKGCAMHRIFSEIRGGGWLTNERMAAYGWILLTCELLGFAFFVAGTHGLIVALDKPSSSDFVSFYAAGRLADAGSGWLAYDHAAHYAAEQQATEPGIGYNYFYYPPVFLLICAVLAWLPYLCAFVAFQAASLAACLLAARPILRDAKLVLLLAFPAVFWTLGTGQNALLTAALFAAATWHIDRRPIVAGLLFGALCYKPHFGLLIPIALVAGGHGRAFAAAACAVLALAAFSGWMFGLQSWTAFLQAMAGSQPIYTTHAIDLSGLASPFGAMLTLGQGPWRAGVVQAIVTLGAAVLVGVVWRRRLSLPVRAAVLLAAIPMATPVVMFYDLMLSGIAIAWLVRAGQERGFAPWTKSLLAVSFVLPLLSGNLGGIDHWLIAPAEAALVLTLAATAAWRERHLQRCAALPIAVSSSAGAA
jgi:alpha-1,2-mannosyltransferase